MRKHTNRKITVAGIIVAFLLFALGIFDQAMEYYAKNMPNSGSGFIMLSLLTLAGGLWLAATVWDKK